MRQVFTSPRIENVEGVAKLLEEHGIEVRITNGRSYRSAIRGNFSYRERADAGPRPAVWIVHSEDQPRARQILRDAGLLQSARLPDDSYLPQTVHSGDARRIVDAAARRTARVRYGLLIAIAVLVVLAFVSTRRAPGDAASAPSTAAPAATPAPAPAPEPVLPSPIAAPSVAYVIATPPALAETLFAAELEAQPSPLVCLAIDGADPAPELLARLRRDGVTLRPASACDENAPGPRLWLEVTRYRTDGSGVGTVNLVLRSVAGDGDRRNETRRLEVERTGDRWRVLRVLPPA